jgi:hypothetical protein
MRDLSVDTYRDEQCLQRFHAGLRLEIPTSWWTDRVGSRRVLMRILLSFGIGEAGAWPNVARVFTC